jgi:hypothetical protein
VRETPLLTFTKADDAGCGTREPGDLDYIIHGHDLERWLSNGNVERGEDVAVRSKALAAELRTMADALERDAHPMTVTLQFARARYAVRAQEILKRVNRNTP